MKLKSVFVCLARGIVAVPLYVLLKLIESTGEALVRHMRRGNRYEPTKCCTLHLAALEHADPEAGIPELR